jgi:hypothetical protein
MRASGTAPSSPPAIASSRGATPASRTAARLRHQHHHAAFPVIRQNRDSLSIIDQMPFGNHAVRHPQFQPKKPIPSIIDQMPGNNFRHICSVPQKLGMTLSQFAHFFVA